MTARRREIELSVDRPVGPAGAGSVRLSAKFEVEPGGSPPDPAELARELDRLKADLDALVGPPIAAAPIARVDRPLSELVDAYRPRQRELVDLLREEGELTGAEHARLVEYLASGRAERASPPAAEVPETERLIATVPIDRPPASTASRARPVTEPERARPVAELLETYQITNLRQAGAVRGRRQISFAEYMALKQHFERLGGGAPDRPGRTDA